MVVDKDTISVERGKLKKMNTHRGKTLFDGKRNDVEAVLSRVVELHPQTFRNTGAVRDVVVRVLAKRIGYEPVVRKWVRDEFEQHGFVSTRPTDKVEMAVLVFVCGMMTNAPRK